MPTTTTTTRPGAVQTVDVPDPLRPIPAPPRNLSKPQPAELPIEAPAPKDDLPPFGARTLTQIHEKLCKPFPLWAVEVKPGATTQDKSRALALAYVDARQYQTRLDRLAGPEGWQVEYLPIGERAIRCRLTILGVSKEDIGECDSGDPNQATSAAMQAFKRACAAFGMGRYLYSLPQPWCDYDGAKKRFTNPEQVAAQIYHLAGLMKSNGDA